MSTPGYLLQQDDFDGPMNMALDEVLWHSAAQDGPYLRFYGWSDRPSISLGYFQSCREVFDRPTWRGLRFVRRVSGGGALVHDRDLTYALALPNCVAPPTGALYERVHRAFAAALGQIGIKCEVGAGAARPPAPDVLCFRRSDRFALTVNGMKVLGSAQRRDAAAVLLHGSLLLGASSVAPELLGMEELTGQPPDVRRLTSTLVEVISSAFDLDMRTDRPVSKLMDQARRLVESKYGRREWNHRT